MMRPDNDVMCGSGENGRLLVAAPAFQFARLELHSEQLRLLTLTLTVLESDTLLLKQNKPKIKANCFCCWNCPRMNKNSWVEICRQVGSE